MWAAEPSAPGDGEVIAAAGSAWTLSALEQPTTQPAGGAAVSSVTFDGSQAVSEAYLRSVVRTAEGDVYDPAAVEADVQRLTRTGKFLSASSEATPGPEGVALRFILVDRPTVSAIRFVGNVKFKEKKLLEQIQVKVGDPIDSFDIQGGRDAIVALYRDKGYGNVNVSHDAELLKQTGELVYTIEEGPRIRVRKIAYEGNASVLESELNKQITTKTYLWIFRDGKFDVDTVESDAAAVQNYYRDLGFLDARASYRLDFSADGSDLTIIFTVVEGTRYTVESIAFEGNTVFTGEDLASAMRIKVGEYAQRPLLDKDVKDIQTRYGEQGYIYAEIRAVRVFSDTPDQVRLTIECKEGEQIRVGRIVPRGNERTKDKVVRRALNLFPEEVFNLTEAREAEQRLIQTQIFSKATVSPVGDAPGVRDALVNVEESAKAGDFIFGVGVTSNSGLIGSIVLDIKNFDLFDYPRSFSEFVRLKSFHGAGQRLRLEAQPGTELTRFRIDFTEPYFLDKPITFGTSLYYFERDRDGYTEQRTGGNISFGKRFTKGPLKDWFGEVAFRLENVDVNDVDLFAARDIKDDEGNNFLTSVKGTLVRDRTDNRFLPTKGDRFRISWDQVGALGGDHFFSELSSGYAWHKTMYTDVQDRKSVLTLRGEGGFIFGDAPVFERFYAGGIGSMRGFEFRGITPREGLQDDGVGGDLLLLAGAEYSFPLYGDNLRGHVFTDMGTVEENFNITGWRMSVGAGVRVTIEFFGPVPLEFNLGFPVASEGEDDEEVFSFFIGAVF